MAQSSIDSTGASRGTLKSYTIGFILSVLLTAAAFWVVMSGNFTYSIALTAIFGVAVAQILVHLYYFLHLDFSSASRWNLLAMIFAVLIMFLFVGGSLWIMYSLNTRMML
jgi:cytochrome o ubiquinol oxidase subunit IV